MPQPPFRADHVGSLLARRPSTPRVIITKPARWTPWAARDRGRGGHRPNPPAGGDWPAIDHRWRGAARILAFRLPGAPGRRHLRQSRQRNELQGRRRLSLQMPDHSTATPPAESTGPAAPTPD